MLSWRKGSQDTPDAGPSLEQVLIEDGLVTEEQIHAAHAEAEEKKVFFGHILIRDSIIEERDFIACLVKNRKIPYLSLIDYDINESLVDLVSEETCRKHYLLPVDKMGKILTIAMVNPLDYDALQAVREACPDLRIKPILCDWRHYCEVSDRHFTKDTKVGGDSSSISMESLGLSKSAPAKKPAKAKEKPAPDPVADLPDPVSIANAADAFSTAPAPTASAPSTTELANAIRDGVAEAMASLSVEMRALVSQLAASTAAAASPSESTTATEAPSPVNTTHTLDTTGLDQVTAALAQVAERIANAPTPDTSNLDQAIAALTQVAQQLGNTAQAAPASAPLTESAPAPSIDTSGLQQATTALTEAANKLMAAADAATRATEAAEAARAQQEAMAQQAAAQADEEETTNESEQELIQSNEKRTRFNSVQAFGSEEKETSGDASVLAMLEAERPLVGFTFDSYCVSASNEFTAKVCQTIAQNPGQNYNPCFVHGAVGSGKTHLLSAVGNAIRAAQPEARVGYASADRFAERMAAAKKENAIEYFREAYAQWDVLILDDAQFLAGNAEAQEEFFHVFNALLQANRQVLIAADKSPKQLGQLEARLISRFESGILTQVEPPDHTTRVAILRQHAKDARANVPDDVLTLIASRIRGDVRTLIGALRKVIAFAETVGQDITSEIADQVLEQLDASESAA